jgi:hypothetical protein
VSAVVLERLRELFLAPGATALPQPAQQVAERVVPATLGVLVSPADAVVAGAALGLAAAAGRRARCAVVCRWSPEPLASSSSSMEPREDAAPPAPRSGLACGAARKLSARLVLRGQAAGAHGRLVTVALPAEGVQARAAVERTLAAAGEVPVIVVVAGPRPVALDPLLATLDRLVIVPGREAPAGLEGLAIDAAARLGRGTGTLRLPFTSVVSRLLAAHGLLLSPPLRGATSVALAGQDG